jgi:hypothetical protein
VLGPNAPASSPIERLLESIRAGAALASLVVVGCGSSDGAPSLPLDAQLQCRGTTMVAGGKWGSCCEHLMCLPPENGRCRDVKDVPTWFPQLSCTCEADPVRGPFVVEPTHPLAVQAMTSGSCCYLVNNVPCEGRPMHVEESIRVAAIALRSDWC